MRIESHRAFIAASPPCTAAEALPPQLHFLLFFGIELARLQEAVAKAMSDGVSPLRALVTGGPISETRYYHCLSRFLDLDFVADWPVPRSPVDVHTALKRGSIALRDDARARWLLAPEADDVERLLRGRARGFVPKAVAITTPSHLARILRHYAAAAIARDASFALPDARPRHTALEAMSPSAAVAIGFTLPALFYGALVGSHLQAIVLGLVFIVGLGFRLLVCAEGMSEAMPSCEPRVDDAELPSYAVLVPLKNEADMVPRLLRALDAIDYPRTKLEISLLVEADDTATRSALARPLPPGFIVIEVPPGEPRTKPRALNVGLMFARADLVTVYDAEDRPDRDQLRRAAARFASGPADLACLQARLVIDGEEGVRCSILERALRRLFAIEYALLFSLFNTGLARWQLPLALGGTSNHFKASILRAIGGWDAWNVTEDADLGIRLARYGHACDMLDSVTREEAPPRLGGWLKQRRRWTKGWLQTLLVLARDLPAAVRDLGPRRALAVTLLLTNLVTGPILTPIFLVLVVFDLARRGLPTPSGFAEWFEATLSFAVIVLGAVGTLWCGFAGAKASGSGERRSVAAFLPYQLMIAVAAWGGLVDLVWRPYHWHKTAHGDAARAASRSRPARRRRLWI